MDILLFSSTNLSALATTSSGKFTMATNQFIPSASSTTKSISNSVWSGYISLKDTDTDLTSGLNIGGNNTPILAVQPKYYPVATKGAECAAIVNDLSWADLNLSNYEFIQLEAASGTRLDVYFVTGVLNSSQTQANDPFGSQGEAQGLITGGGCCWAGTYTEGLNPF